MGDIFLKLLHLSQRKGIAFIVYRGYIIVIEMYNSVQNYREIQKMKTFEALFAELKNKAANGDPNSGTVKELAKGTHFIGKKIVEEAGETWIAAEYEGKERTAEEISQLLYHLQVMMIDRGLKLEDIYRYL